MPTSGKMQVSKEGKNLNPAKSRQFIISKILWIAYVQYRNPLRQTTVKIQ